MDPYIGKLLDNRYEILEVIGTGGMAVVYKALCHRLNRMVAVKILKSDLAHDADFRRRFHDESQAVAMLSHPNIVAVYDVSRSSDVEYIVMELIDGITLKQYMQRRGQLNWRESLHFIIQIMRALRHAHSRGIIHRDIKPHNIMILRDGSVKVADFGIARLTSSSQNTLTQEALGSVHYISPEQARGSHIDARSDIYSAGVVLYEMITNRLPFEGDSPVSVAIQHINSIPLSPREINPDIPEALEAITMKAMAADPDRRYESADAMLTDLEEFRKNPGINFEYSAADFTRDADGGEPTQVIAPARSGNSGRYKTGGRDLRYEQEERDDYPQRSRRGKKNNTVTVVSIVVVVLVIVFLWAFIFRSFMSPSSQELTVPDLTGLTMEQAQDQVGETFTLVEGDPEYDDNYEAGKIISQNPEKDRQVKAANNQITVVLSLGPKMTTMPNLVNKEAREAELELDKLDLNLKIIRQTSDSETINKDYVISTDPAEGAQLTKDQQVTLVVSTGPKVVMVTVPSFINLNIDAVRTQMESLKLTVGNVNQADSAKEAGTVLNQSVAPTSSVPEGTTIDFEVSKGSSGTQPSVTPVTLTQTISLPPGEGNVHVVVELDNAVVFDKTVSKSLGSVNIPVSGTGTKWMYIYFDGVLSDSREITFN